MSLRLSSWNVRNVVIVVIIIKKKKMADATAPGEEQNKIAVVN